METKATGKKHNNSSGRTVREGSGSAGYKNTGTSYNSFSEKSGRSARSNTVNRNGTREKRERIEEERIRREIQQKRAKSRAKKRKRAIRLAIICTVFTIVVILGTAFMVLHLLSDKEALREAGIAAFQEGNYEEAEKDFIASLGEKQWFTDKMDDDTRLYLAGCYMHTGEYIKARDQYSTLYSNGTKIMDENKLKGYISFANALDTAGNGHMDDTTINTLNTEIENGNTSVSIILGGYYQSQKDYDKMISYYDTYVKDFGINTYIAYQMSSYYIMNNDYEAASDYISRGLSAEDDLYMDKLLFNEAVLLEKNIDYQGAFDKISALCEKYPDNETFRREYDYLYSRLNIDTEPVNGDGESSD